MSFISVEFFKRLTKIFAKTLSLSKETAKSDPLPCRRHIGKREDSGDEACDVLLS